MPTPYDWLNQLRLMLCQMYEAWGGDCSDLGATSGAWVDTVTGEFAEEGAPDFTGQADQLAAFLSTLAALTLHLASPMNTLGATDTNRLVALIASLEGDLNPTS